MAAVCAAICCACRCERCRAEEQLGQALNNKLKSGNTAAARMGPQIAAAASAFDKAAADKAAADEAAAAAADTTTSPPPPSPPPPAAAGGGDDSREVLQRCAGRLSSIIQEVEGAVDHPEIPARAAAWAHASMYQVWVCVG